MAGLIWNLRRIVFRDKNDILEYEKLNNKVCMIVWNYFQTDARVTKEATTLGKFGKEVMVIAINDHKTTPEYEIREYFKISRVSRKPFGYSLYMNKNLLSKAFLAPFILLQKIVGLKVLTTIRFTIYAIKNRAGVYHAHDLNTGIPAYIASRFWGTRLIYDAHEVSTDRVGWKFKKFYFILEWFIIKRADVTITTTETRALFFQNTYKINKPIILRNAPNYQEINSDDRIRKKLNIDPKTKVILYQGGLQPERGLENLVEAIKDIPNVVLVFIGYGKLEDKLKNKVKELKLEEKVFFLGMIPNEELLYWTASADVGMQVLQNTCFNHYSALSNKIHEYIMAGLPMVASNLPEMEKVINEYKIGVNVNPDNPDEIKKGILFLLTNDKVYKEFKQNCTKAARKLNWENEEEKLIKIYNI